ncbi:MAG: sigma-70 family RNA polymerase sigma factor [Pirellulaceae bacterium]
MGLETTCNKTTRTINPEPSQDEFVRLLAMHSSKLMSFIRIITMNHGDETEEVFQLTCMVLWQKFSQYDKNGNFAAWACRIAHYEMLKLQESKRRIKLLSDEAIESLAMAALPIASEINERRDALSNCLAKLPMSDHDLIRQRYFDGLSVGEVAKRVDRSTHAIYRELSRIHGILSRCVHRAVREEIQ